MSAVGTTAWRARAAAALRAALLRPRGAVTWVALAVLGVGAVATVAVLIWAATYDPQLPTSAGEVGLAAITVVAVVAFVAWALAPFAAMAALVQRRDGAGRVVGAVVAVGALAVTGLGGWALVGFVTSESSTSALIFIFLPFYQLVVVAVCALVALGACALVRWHHRRQRPPGAAGAGGPS